MTTLLQMRKRNQRLDIEHHKMKLFLQSMSKQIDDTIPPNVQKIMELEQIRDDIHQLNKIKEKAQKKLNACKETKNLLTSSDYYFKIHKANFRPTYLKLLDHNEFYKYKFKNDPDCKWCFLTQPACQLCFFKNLTKNNFSGAKERLNSLQMYARKNDISKLPCGYKYSLNVLKK